MSQHLAPLTAAGRALHGFADSHPRLTADSLRPYVGILGVLIGSIVATLFSRVTTFGLSDLRGGLHAGFDEGAWITTSFGIGQMIAGVASPYAGAIPGVRRVLLLGMALTFISSLLGPLPPKLSAFLVMQVMGSIGSGTFIPLTISFVVRSLPARLVMYGVALYAMNSELSQNVAASLEGWYTETGSWQWIGWQYCAALPVMFACISSGVPAACRLPFHHPVHRLHHPHLPSDRAELPRLQVGTVLLWIALPQLVIALPLAALLRRIDARWILALGTALIGVACWMGTDLTSEWATEDFLPSQILQALGQSFALTALLGLIIRCMNPIDALAIGSLLQISRVFGGGLGTAFMQTFVRVREQVHSNLVGMHIDSLATQTADRLAAYQGAVAAHTADAAEAAGRAANCWPRRWRSRPLCCPI
jgi:MFS family permease